LAGATIDLYAGDSNQANRLEGIEWLGSGPVDVNGFFSILISSCICDSLVATATDPLGNTSQFSDGVGTITSVRDVPVLDKVSAFPNPFYQEVTIHVTLQESEKIKLEIYDVMGKKVESLVDEHLLAGKYQFNWSPENASAGIYYFSLISGKGKTVTGKLILID
jgi:hypothetical protein